MDKTLEKILNLLIEEDKTLHPDPMRDFGGCDWPDEHDIKTRSYADGILEGKRELIRKINSIVKWG